MRRTVCFAGYAWRLNFFIAWECWVVGVVRFRPWTWFAHLGPFALRWERQEPAWVYRNNRRILDPWIRKFYPERSR